MDVSERLTGFNIYIKVHEEMCERAWLAKEPVSIKEPVSERFSQNYQCLKDSAKNTLIVFFY